MSLIPSLESVLLKQTRNFGKPGSTFDFSANDMGQLREKARELEEQQKGMKKKINPKVLNMIDRCEVQSLVVIARLSRVQC